MSDNTNIFRRKFDNGENLLFCHYQNKEDNAIVKYSINGKIVSRSTFHNVEDYATIRNHTASCYSTVSCKVNWKHCKTIQKRA